MFNQQPMNQQSLQYTNPALYMEMVQKGVSNPDLFAHWMTTNEGRAAIEETERYLISTFNTLMTNAGKSNVPSEEIIQVAQENQALKAQLDKNDKDMAELKEMFLASQKGGKNGNK